MPSLLTEPSIYFFVAAITVCRFSSKSGSARSISGEYFTKSCGIYRFLLIRMSPFAYPQRSLLGVVVLAFTSCIELSQPVQRSDAGQEAVLTPLRGHKPGYAMQAPAYRALRDGKSAAAVVRSGD